MTQRDPKRITMFSFRMTRYIPRILLSEIVEVFPMIQSPFLPDDVKITLPQIECNVYLGHHIHSTSVAQCANSILTKYYIATLILIRTHAMRNGIPHSIQARLRKHKTPSDVSV